MKIEISTHQGLASITGIVTSLEQELFNQYLNEHLEEGPKNILINYLKSEIGQQDFTLLKNIFLEKELRGQGIGQALMNEFLGKAQGPVLLICDNLESQHSGFSLQDWYVQKYHFQETGINTLSGPFLIRF